MFIPVYTNITTLVKSMMTIESSFPIRSMSLKWAFSILNPLDFNASNALCKALHNLFKWIKQNLTIKTIWGHYENAVNIPIWIAIFTYLIVASIKIQLKSPLSTYEIIKILGISSFDKTQIRERVTEFQINQNVNEQYNLFIRSLKRI